MASLPESAIVLEYVSMRLLSIKLSPTYVPLFLTLALCLSPLARASDESLFVSYLRLFEQKPQTIEDFINALGRAGRNLDKSLEDLSLTATVPQGRSLQKNTVRNLFAMQFKSGVTFIAFSKITNKGEVISWNPPFQRFDFLQFSKLGVPDQSLIVKEANRNFCLSCHQSGGPIFPRAPWREMTEAALFKKFDVTESQFLGLSPAVQEQRRFQNLHFFDELVRSENRRLQRSQACGSICDKDPECLEMLRKTATLYHNNADRRFEFETLAEDIQHGRRVKGPFAFSSMPQAFFDRLEALVQRHWPKSDFAIVSSTLLDRSVTKNIGFKLTAKLRNSEDPNFSDAFSSVAVESLGKDYASKMIRDLDNFKKNEMLIGHLKEHKLKKSEAKMLDPISTRPLINRIPKYFAGRWASAIAYDCFSGSSEKRNVDGAKIIQDLQAQANPFSKYCYQCHGRVDAEFPLRLDNLSWLKDYRGLTYRSVLAAMQEGMPPEDSLQPSKQEREEMIKALK